MKILVTGANGLLGQRIIAQLKKQKIQFLATSQGVNRNDDCPQEHYVSLDITDKIQVESVVSSFHPTHIIHTAALTNVDQCEINPEDCQRINVDGTRFLFEVSIINNVHFQLLSTDFVFDGKKGNYSEDDEVNPLSIYARSKVDAENLLRNSDYNNWSIVRTIIVYGNGNNLSRSNLLSWTKSALPKQETMKVIDDQFRAPTWANDLAWGCIRICELQKSGIYHLSGPTTYSIYEIVELIANYDNWSMQNVQRISSNELNQSAKRPPRTGFDLTKAKQELGYQPKTIQETLGLF